MNGAGARVLIVALAAALFGGCATVAPPAPPLQHVVLFTLDEPGAVTELIADARLLADLDEVAFYQVGTPLDLGRPGVDGDYHVGFVIGFDDTDAYEAYLDHPVHADLVRRWGDRFVNIRVFDFMAK